MWKKITHLIYGEDCELKERMLRTIIMIGGLATIVAILEIIIVMKMDMVLVSYLILALLAMGGSLFATFKYRKYDVAAILIGVIIIVIVFPPMFCLSGGIESGASIWLTLGILYIFIMFTGKRLAFFMVLSALVYGCTYLAAYFYPDMLTPMPSKAVVYIDSIFSVLAVGVCAGLIFKIQMRVFEKEHKLNVKQREEVKKSSDSKNAFFANMSHEIRTPINTIIGLNEMILRQNTDEETREYARDIQLASKMLLSQVNDILDLSQMELQKMKILPAKYETAELFGELVEMIRVQIDKKGLEFHLDIDQNLPSALIGDEKRIRQVILNLLDNAVKYTKEGSVILSVHGEEKGEGMYALEVKVADTGIGIRKEDMEHIYDSFNRADEKKNTRITGSGLGLTITKQLVDLMDGEITIDSIYTKGSVFTILLKQKIVDRTPISTSELLKKGNQKSAYYQPTFEAPEARILLVDDNDMNALVASKLLMATKVQVDIANSGLECLEMTKKKYYNVILLDYMMPGMNGQETLKELRSQENGLCRDTAVIALTASAVSGSSREVYIEKGFDGYVEKPIQGKLLETEILKFLPPDIIEYQEEESIRTETSSQIQRSAMKKRKKIYITTDCACDLPAELLEKYDIRLMYLYIKTPYGRFADTREIDSDSLSQYMSVDDSTILADSVMIEEYEEFFADVLTQAEQVIHISLGSRTGASYEKSLHAASGFGHVRVIDSGQVSCGQGLVTLYAAKLAADGKNVNEICVAVEKMLGHIRTHFIMPNADMFHRNGRTSAAVAKMCHMFQLHPLVAMRQKKAVLAGVMGGSLEATWRMWIRLSLLNKRKINKEVVFITHVGCNVKQQEWIKEEILKCVPFERVIFQKASLTVACNSGMHALGFSYFSL